MSNTNNDPDKVIGIFQGLSIRKCVRVCCWYLWWPRIAIVYHNMLERGVKPIDAYKKLR